MVAVVGSGPLTAGLMAAHFPLSADQIGKNPGLQAIWEDEKLRRREKNESSQIETPESQGKGRPNLRLDEVGV